MFTYEIIKGTLEDWQDLKFANDAQDIFFTIWTTIMVIISIIPFMFIDILVSPLEIISYIIYKNRK